jgi:uncharacterized iron-regulated membrane protein
MNVLTSPSATASADWLIYLAGLLALGLILAGTVFWVMARKSGQKPARRRRKHRHHRRHNPTLAQTTGLPPLRDPNQPPPGP